MSIKRRLFRRPLGERRYKKLFVIAVEGNKTEPQYFAMLCGHHSVVKIRCLNDSRSSPLQVLDRMKKYLRKESLLKSDEAWLVVDKDEWNEKHLLQLLTWTQQHDNYGFALSNPNFEYWILLHFEVGNGVSNGRECLNRLRRYLPNYEKNIIPHKIDREMIMRAIKRAKQRDNPPCKNWPRACGTTVYKLVENILKS